MISVRGACPKEVVQPKCDELSRVCDMVTERLSRRLEILLKSRDLMERVEKVCSWFTLFGWFLSERNNVCLGSYDKKVREKQKLNSNSHTKNAP